MTYQTTKDRGLKIEAKLLEPLDVGEYTATEEFKGIERHTCICRRDGSLVAVTGPVDDREAIDYAILFAAAPDYALMLRAIVAGRLRYERWDDRSGELCCFGLRHATNIDDFGCPKLTNNVRRELQEAEGKQP